MATTEQSRTPTDRAECKVQNVQGLPVVTRQEPGGALPPSTHVLNQSTNINDDPIESIFRGNTSLVTQLRKPLHGTLGFAQYCDCALCEDVKDGQTSSPPALSASSARVSDLLSLPPTKSPSPSHACLGADAVYPPDYHKKLFASRGHDFSTAPPGDCIELQKHSRLPVLPTNLGILDRQTWRKNEAVSWRELRSNRFGLRIVIPRFGRAIETESTNDEEGEDDEEL